ILDRQTAFEAAAHEDLHEAVEKRVNAFLEALDGCLIDMGLARNLGGERLVPNFPAQARGELFGDSGSARAVLALDGDDADHSPTYRQSLLRPDVACHLQIYI